MINSSMLVEKAKNMDVSAKITGIKYSPFSCRKLNVHNIFCLDSALAADGTFILQFDEKTQIALSWWVSAKEHELTHMQECMTL